MAFAFRVQRLVAGTGAGISLLWGVLVGMPLTGLWAAAWIVSLMCAGIGALTVEYHRNRPDRLRPLQHDASRVVNSGYGYLLACGSAALLPAGFSAIVLLAVLADFAADHHVAESQRIRVPAGH